MTVHYLPKLTSGWVRAALAPALIFLATVSDNNYLNDFWHHLARGRAIVESGDLVDYDLFTYTVPNEPFQDVNWLSQVIYYHLYEEGGLPLVQLVNSLTLALMMGLLVFVCSRVSGSLAVASALGVFTFFGLWQVLTIRPQTFSFLLFVLLYGIMTLAQRHAMWLLAAPPVLATWTNLHGAFPAGLVLIGAFLLAAVWDAGRAKMATLSPSLADSRWRRGVEVVRAAFFSRRPLVLGFCLLASVLATFVNPYGWEVWHYVATTSGRAAQRQIDEWLPPSLDLLVGKVWVVSLVLVVVAFALPRRRPTSRDVCLAVCFLPLACSSARMIPWWLLVMAPTVSALIAANLPQNGKAGAEEPSVGAAAMFGLLLLAVVLSLPGLSQFNPLLNISRSGPRGEEDLDAITATLKEKDGEGRIFTRFEWGEYLSWSLSPGYTVFMDGRIEIYPDHVWREYSTVTRGGPDWEQILDGYKVDYLLLDVIYHSKTGLLPVVEQSRRWHQIAQVGDARLFGRAKP